MQLFHLKGRALLFILLILLDYFLGLLSNKRQCFRLSNQGNHGFFGPKSDRDLLNNRKRCRLIAKQICVSGKTVGHVTWLSVIPDNHFSWMHPGYRHTRGLINLRPSQPIASESVIYQTIQYS